VGRRTIPQGLKPNGFFIGIYGTTEVVPCYKTGALFGFSASCEALFIVERITDGLKRVPFKADAASGFFRKLLVCCLRSS
jgi:hypothetical protein